MAKKSAFPAYTFQVVAKTGDVIDGHKLDDGLILCGLTDDGQALFMSDGSQKPFVSFLGNKATAYVGKPVMGRTMTFLNFPYLSKRGHIVQLVGTDKGSIILVDDKPSI